MSNWAGAMVERRVPTCSLRLCPYPESHHDWHHKNDDYFEIAPTPGLRSGWATT